MIQHAIAALFGITALSPIKEVWVAITCANVAMMLRLSWNSGVRAMGGYMLVSAIDSLTQGISSYWNEGGEIFWAWAASYWVWSMLPKDKHGRIFALSIGLVVTCVLIYACPPPWKGYPPDLYFTRLYSTAAFFGISSGIAVLEYWIRWESKSMRVLIPPVWFAAVLIACTQRGVNRWTIAIVTNCMWSGCLVAWLILSRRTHEADSIESGIRGAGGRRGLREGQSV
jgi:hypothetical protein